MYAQYREYLRKSRSMSAANSPQYVELPSDVIKQGSGFSMDFGSTLIKLIYRPKKLETTIKPRPGFDFLKVKSFNHADLEIALNELLTCCDVTREAGRETLIHTTGVGIHWHDKLIKSKLKIGVKSILEFDCFVKAFISMCKYLPKDDLVIGPHPVADEIRDKFVKIFLLMSQDKETSVLAPTTEELKKHQDTAVEMTASSSSSKPYAESDPNLFPSLLVMCGSAVGIYVVEADGSFAMLDGSSRGGRAFLGLGYALTGAKTYDELMTLAEKGDGKSCDVYQDEMIHANTGGDAVYEKYRMDDILLFSFGKMAEGNSEAIPPSKADIARSLVKFLCMDLAQIGHLGALSKGIKNVFYCGNFVNSDVVKYEISKAMGFRLINPQLGHPVNYYFLKNGGYYGALGAYIENAKQQST